MKRSVTTRNVTELLSARDAAELLPDTTPATLLRWGREGRIPVVRLPGRVYFRRSDLEAMLEPTVSEQQHAGQPELPFDELLEPGE